MRVCSKTPLRGGKLRRCGGETRSLYSGQCPIVLGPTWAKRQWGSMRTLPRGRHYHRRSPQKLWRELLQLRHAMKSDQAGSFTQPEILKFRHQNTAAETSGPEGKGREGAEWKGRGNTSGPHKRVRTEDGTATALSGPVPKQ